MQFNHLKRREFITLLGAAAASPLTARGQQPDRMRRIGLLMTASENDPGYQVLLTTFRDELKKLGWEEGRNILIEYRWKAIDKKSRQQLAKELVVLQPDLMLAQSTTNTAALVQQTSAIPIIFFSVGDPVGEGFVAGLPRPGRNVTGFINMEASMSGKWLELLKEIAPNIRRVAILFNPATAPRGGSYYLDPFNAAAQSLGLETIAAHVHDTSEIETVIAAQAHEPNTGLVVMSDVFPLVHRTEITALTARYRLPAVYPYRQFAEVGGLLSYGNDLRDNYRRAATYTDRILRGEQPSELPVEIPVKFELVINLKAAKTLGLTIPPAIMLRADEVIE
jgi:putative tryptophan/tyrosine transport system substrate-binding protein